MWYTIVADGVPLGVVDLSPRAIAAARVHPLPGYHTVESTVRWATEAILHLGLFGIAAPRESPLSIGAIHQRRAFAHAARLRLELIAEGGRQTPTTFLNLLQAPADGGVIAVANFMTASSPVGAVIDAQPDEPGVGGFSRFSRNSE